ncbi:MAG: hypothetical protein PHD54_07765 [Desulfuromonadaceae bacterium]|nr:hypothetical protein [Desulfuromonadaceae bacterium]
MTDYHHADAENKMREMGYPFILKPGRAEIKTPAILQNFLSLLLHDIPILERKLYERVAN